MYRNADGTDSYDLAVGFVAWETDEYGYINARAEANYEFWSGLYVDDILITSVAPYKLYLLIQSYYLDQLSHVTSLKHNLNGKMYHTQIIE
jgi:hypothetical protein